MKSTFTISIKPVHTRFLWMIGLCFTIFMENANAQAWSPLGSGMNDWVYASTVYNGKLIVGGKFTSAGGVAANHIASWDGSTWAPLGLGVNGKVNALIVNNGLLYVGGEFTQAGGIVMNFIATWNGTEWSDKLGDMANTVTSLAIYNDRLIVGGYFTDADDVPLNYIAQRTDTGWAGLGSGTVGTEGQVMAMEVYNNELVAGGFFTSAGGVPANHVAKWNGTSWSALGSGISNIVYSFTNYNGNLIAGGLFLQAGGVPANHIASWNGTTWSPLGSGMSGVLYQYVFALKPYHGKLIAGGYFTHSGGILTNGIAEWDGTSWKAMGGGLFQPGNVCGTHTMTLYNDNLIVGGLFNTAGSALNASHIASWNDPNILAVTFKEFSVVVVDNKTELKWNIENDVDVIRYEIEKSSDGLHFTQMGTMASVKTSYAYQYLFYDNAPLASTNFYRIKIYKTNNEIQFSKICRVVFNNHNNNNLNVISNPSKQSILLQLNNVPGGTYTLSIFNALGQQIFTDVIHHDGSNNSVPVILRYNTDKGIYQLKLYNSLQQFHKGFMLY